MLAVRNLGEFTIPAIFYQAFFPGATHEPSWLIAEASILRVLQIDRVYNASLCAVLTVVLFLLQQSPKMCSPSIIFALCSILPYVIARPTQEVLVSRKCYMSYSPSKGLRVVFYF